MENKKIIMYIVIVMLILFIIGIGVLMSNNYKKRRKINDYTPAEEITDEQLRKTNITLYFYNPSTCELAIEMRQIDSKKLLNYPEKELIQYLLQGPQNDNLKRIIPEGTELINTEIQKGILYINFNEKLIENQNIGNEQEKVMIDSIVKTVAQLTEISGIRILINGEENCEFPDKELNFKDVFLIN